MTDANLGHGLNPAQLDAVMRTDGQSLVLAGAGSGKTRVITHKIARLIQQGMGPENIFAITFTNKAASEMRERSQKLVGKLAKKVALCTFHALGVRLLREDGQAIGLKNNFSILDSHDVLNLVKDAGSATDLASAKIWQWEISRLKSAGIASSEALAHATTDEERHIALVMQRYEERLLAYQSVDFDDLITLPLNLLKNHEAVRQKWQKMAGHILVDEYQDTNATQYELLKLLAGDPEQAAFTAVGDDDQSIYGWRGATLENLKKLPQDFPALKVIKLEQNYRSVESILRAANNVISLNPKLFPKNLWSDLGKGEPITLAQTATEEDEAEQMVSRIKHLRAVSESGQRDYKNFAVLYRANHQAKLLEKALRRANIPYKVSGGQSFFERTEIRDLCAWFRLISNENDDPAFLRAIGTPKRGIGHQTLTKLGGFAAQYKISLFESLFTSSLSSVINDKFLDMLHEFGRHVNDVQHRFKHVNGAESAKQTLMDWLVEIGYEKYLYESEENEKQASNRWTNVLEFVDWMSKRCGGEQEGDNLMSKTKTLLEAAQSIALLSTLSEREKEQDVVTLSTLHAAKGLEWPHVLLVGVYEGALPFQPKDSMDGNLSDEELHEGDDGFPAHLAERIQEERRLMYVGITRAQRTLQVSWPARRKKGRDQVATKPSRFIEEMKLNEEQNEVDPREKLKSLRETLAQKAKEAKETLSRTTR